jgi:hypothetical protein
LVEGCEGLTIFYELEIKKPDYLFIKVKGERTVDSIKEVTKKIAEKCSKQKCMKVLIDVREFTERINFSDIFDLVARDLPNITKNKINKAAIVDIEGHNFNKEFFENVAVNRGHNVKIFTDINDAMDWLS